jgi:hypothetical protein
MRDLTTREPGRAGSRKTVGCESRCGVARRFDASPFVNAFHPHEAGHESSFAFLSAIRERGDPIIVPTLVVPEVATWCR